MNDRKLTASTLLSVCLALGGPLAADEKAKGEGKPNPQMEAMMKAWTAQSTPGEAHKRLDGMVGTWTDHVRFWMAPGAPPNESDGTSEMKWVLGGRFVEQHSEGTSMGQPFSGIGYTGYDNYKKEYVSTWVDNMSTSLMLTNGKADASGKTITSSGMMDNVVTKKAERVKAVATFVDTDHMTYEMWGPGPDGKMFKTLQVDYTRKK